MCVAKPDRADEDASAEGLPVRQAFRPLFQLDPGWPFVLAGLALLVAAILIPAQRELHELRVEARKAEVQENRTYARLMAYDRFLSDLRAGDSQLVRRLAIAQLNLVPKGEESLLLTPGMNQTVAQWIDESVPSLDEAIARIDAETPAYPDTLLARFALGPNRLWLIAGAVFLLFVGLLLSPDGNRSAVVEPKPGPAPEPDDLAEHAVPAAKVASPGSMDRALLDERRSWGDADVIDVELVEADDPAAEFEPDAAIVDRVDGRGVPDLAEAYDRDEPWPTAAPEALDAAGRRVESAEPCGIDVDADFGQAFHDRVDRVAPEPDETRPARNGAD
jgi:hypothetical protein